MTVCDKCGRKLVSKMGGRVMCLCSPDITVAEVPKQVEDAKRRIAEKKESQGRAAWANLHTYKYTTEREARLFYDFWQLTIPSFGCSCKSHWAELIKEFPPDFSSAKAFFKWGVDAHNKVNERLGKPQFSYEEAKVVYNFTDTF